MEFGNLIPVLPLIRYLTLMGVIVGQSPAWWEFRYRIGDRNSVHAIPACLQVGSQIGRFRECQSTESLSIPLNKTKNLHLPRRWRRGSA